MAHATVCWGSGRAKCAECNLPILKGDVQLAFFGYRTSARYHARCLFKSALELVKNVPRFHAKKDIAETIKQMKEFIARRDEIMLKGHSLKVGDTVWNAEGEVGKVKKIVDKHKVAVKFTKEDPAVVCEVWYLTKKGGDEDEVS